jgi:hypothetical protein
MVALLGAKIPGFGQRRLDYGDFLAVCRRERIRVETRPYLWDEYLNRWGSRPTITLNTGLTPTYKTFVAFHALGHWFLHPGDIEYYLGSPGWLDQTEIEASTVALLALNPWPAGPPYPTLERAHTDGDLMRLWVAFPERRPGERMGWRRRRVALQRYVQGQLEFEW